MDLVTWRTLPSHYVAACAAIQDNLNHNVFPILDTKNDVIFFRLENAQLRAVDASVILIPSSLVHELLMSDSSGSGWID